LIGSPSYRCPWLLRISKNGFQVVLPFLLFKKVSMFPINTIQLRARVMRTFRRSGADMNPISPVGLLLVNDAMTISLSSP
jgi:hypothetical protein